MTGSQQRVTKAGVMCGLYLVFVKSIAAEFWTIIYYLFIICCKRENMLRLLNKTIQQSTPDTIKSWLTFSKSFGSYGVQNLGWDHHQMGQLNFKFCITVFGRRKLFIVIQIQFFHLKDPSYELRTVGHNVNLVIKIFFKEIFRLLTSNICL